MYDFCKSMMEVAIAPGNKAAIAMLDDRTQDVIMIYGYEAGFFGE